MTPNRVPYVLITCCVTIVAVMGVLIWALATG